MWRLEVVTGIPPGRLLSPQLALIVAQERDRANNLSGIHLSALDEGLKKIYVAAKKRKGESKGRSVLSLWEGGLRGRVQQVLAHYW